MNKDDARCRASAIAILVPNLKLLPPEVLLPPEILYRTVEWCGAPDLHVLEVSPPTISPGKLQLIPISFQSNTNQLATRSDTGLRE
jgi:hypothetical protein